jgi:hypothetical protein
VQDRPPTNPGKAPTQTGAERREDERTDAADKARVPTVTRMPEGYHVLEQRTGRAVAQWVLQVRCQCGRRWFEVEAIDATHCPRCGSLVYVDVKDRSR